ncbi:transcriptional regulator [Actinotignum urinale]|uniref:Transcriptional regulator n=1 Tax=Actinotignum urinale TaxID=190146 RepID=A0ABU5G517_9ACTO|nr:transcriptional regulator [Actinotignum urinale]MDY5132272.1 transcriptional regulator [Actinotignum urinale]
MTIHYLALTDLATRIGITLNTAKSYSAKGLLPPPDAHTGSGIRAVRGWLPETIDEWNANRPGRGARTDLKK